MKHRVLVTPRSFGKHSEEPLNLLRGEGIEIVMNPYGRILTQEEMMREVADIDGVIIGVDPLNREVLQQASRLKVISKYGVGTDNIDIQFAKERGIPVTVTPGANSDAVADYALALMLAAARKVPLIDRECRKRNWSKITTVDVWQKTLGLIGMGQIGKGVALRAKGFNMKTIAYDVVPDVDFAAKHGLIYMDSIESVLREADFISLHLPLTQQTHHLIRAEHFAIMKANAVLINTARGGLIDEEALYKALKKGQIWGAGIDVFEQEPPSNLDLLTLDNMVIGSHSAASTFQAVDNMGNQAANNLIAHLLK